MKINSHNTFDPLQEVILGSVSTSVLDTVENPNKRYILEEIINDTAEDLDAISDILTKFGVTVLRPDTSGVDFSKCHSTPYFEITGHRVPLSPRDLFFAYNDTIITTATADQNRYFESLYYNKIFQRYMDHDSHVISMPMATLEDSIYEDKENIPDFGYYNNSFPMMSAANFQKYGKDIFYSAYTTINDSALRWIKKQLGDAYRFHAMPSQVRGHIDACINILKPGVIASNLPKNQLPEFFANWTVITDQDIFKNRSYNALPDFISDNIQDDDFENTELGLNMFCIDQQNVLVYNTIKTSLLKQIEKAGFNPIQVNFRHTHFLNQGFTCITLDTVRAGNLEDYLT